MSAHIVKTRKLLQPSVCLLFTCSELAVQLLCHIQRSPAPVLFGSCQQLAASTLTSQWAKSLPCNDILSQGGCECLVQCSLKRPDSPSNHSEQSSFLAMPPFSKIIVIVLLRLTLKRPDMFWKDLRAHDCLPVAVACQLVHPDYCC